MKHSTALRLLLALTPFAVISSLRAADSPDAPSIASSGWDWSIGASAAYLFDYEEPMFSLSVGRRLEWSPFGAEVDVYLEGGRIEDDNGSGFAYSPSHLDYDLQIVPVTFNIRFEKSLTDRFSFYYGLGLGAAFTEIIVDRTDRDQDVVFTGQVFAGVSFALANHSDLFAGARFLYFRDTENYTMDNDGALEIGYRWRF